MYQGPDFKHIIAFIAIAEEHSFSRAAKKLHLSQPALSAQIRQLEVGLAVPLFRRTRSGAELTHSGRILLSFARKLIALRAECLDETSANHVGKHKPLRLGYSPFAHHLLVKEAFVGYGELAPEGAINAFSEPTARIVKMVQDRQLDAGLITAPVEADGLCQRRICRERLLICMRRDDPLATEETMPKHTISERLKIMVAPSHHPELHARIRRKFKKAGMPLSPTEFVSTPNDIQFLVRARKCLALVRETAVLEPELIARPIPGLDMNISTSLVFRSDDKRAVLPLLGIRLVEVWRDLLMDQKKPSNSVRIHPKQAEDAT
ncbi:MAG: LysR family transcriptional regulator [Acidobacteriota bacterium]|nr:LysR family transcriptional regulator [Acidobacteriota bacterium]